jgi:hypothetical protein
MLEMIEEENSEYRFHPLIQLGHHSKVEIITVLNLMFFLLHQMKKLLLLVHQIKIVQLSILKMMMKMVLIEQSHQILPMKKLIKKKMLLKNKNLDVLSIK